MVNLTITVDGETLKRARIQAIEQGESVNQYLARKLSEYAEGGLSERRTSAARQLVALSQELEGRQCRCVVDPRGSVRRRIARRHRVRPSRDVALARGLDLA